MNQPEVKSYLITWLEKQEEVIAFDGVSHTYLNESTGAMFCSICNAEEKIPGNPRHALVAYIRQVVLFENFTERHLHGQPVGKVN